MNSLSLIRRSQAALDQSTPSSSEMSKPSRTTPSISIASVRRVRSRRRRWSGRRTGRENLFLAGQLLSRGGQLLRRRRASVAVLSFIVLTHFVVLGLSCSARVSGSAARRRGIGPARVRRRSRPGGWGARQSGRAAARVDARPIHRVVDGLTPETRTVRPNLHLDFQFLDAGDFGDRDEVLGRH